MSVEEFRISGPTFNVRSCSATGSRGGSSKVAESALNRFCYLGGGTASLVAVIVSRACCLR